ncbi:MAG: hypothetical protein OXC79_11970 [Candidatus Poribacteria bacterium]|nr:hypothetical protein [Candidatus Poribacteria bacterium]
MKWYERIAAIDAIKNLGRNFGHDCRAETFLAVTQTRGNKRRYYLVCKTCRNTVKSVHLRDLSTRDKQTAVRYDKTEARKWWEDQYSRYLQSPTWKAKRQKVMKRANHICEGCLEQKATQVHHLTYERVGCEMLFDLVAICDRCHSNCHPQNNNKEMYGVG